LPHEIPLIISLGQSASEEKRSYRLTPLIRALSLDKPQPQACSCPNATHPFKERVMLYNSLKKVLQEASLIYNHGGAFFI